MHPRTLHLHSSGDAVRALQMLLRKYEPGLAADGRFGRKTERAVRVAQRKLAVFPVDGLAGPQTLAALARSARGSAAPTTPSTPTFSARSEAMAQRVEAASIEFGRETLNTVEAAARTIETWIEGLHFRAERVPAVLHPVVPPAKAKAQHDPMPPGEIADPKSMSLSEPGRRFVFRHEAGDGHTTAHLHHPHGHSGVTLGPGYDMKARKAKDIETDLRRIDVDPAIAAAAAKGAGLHDEDAGAFVKANKSLLNLSLAQQVQLQLNYKGHYEQMVRNAVRIPLHQYEFDALVSFAGNPGSRNIWQTTTRLVNERRPPEAMAEIFKATHTGDSSLVQGLINRRKAESRLFLFGDYSA